MNILLIICSVVATWVAQLLFRIWMKGYNFDWLLNFLYYVISSKYIILGIIIMVLWMILWFIVLSKNEVSFAYPFTAISYIIIFVGGFFLGETVNLVKIIWFILILSGLIFVIKS